MINGTNSARESLIGGNSKSSSQAPDLKCFTTNSCTRLAFGGICAASAIVAVTVVTSMLTGNHHGLLPSAQDGAAPSMAPLTAPSSSPTEFPSSRPSNLRFEPSAAPSSAPSNRPSEAPSSSPSYLRFEPSAAPSSAPSNGPSEAPSYSPSHLRGTPSSAAPSRAPSQAPSSAETNPPSIAPSTDPSTAPSQAPSIAPSSAETNPPSANPSTIPSTDPSTVPSANPSTNPSTAPSANPSMIPSTDPSTTPSQAPSTAPSTNPTNAPSLWAFSNAPSQQATTLPTVFATTSENIRQIGLANGTPNYLCLSSEGHNGVTCADGSCASIIAPGATQYLTAAADAPSYASADLYYNIDTQANCQGYFTNMGLKATIDDANNLSLRLTQNGGAVTLDQSGTDYVVHLSSNIPAPSAAPATAPVISAAPSAAPTTRSPTLSNAPTAARPTTAPTQSAAPFPPTPNGTTETSVWYIDWTSWFTGPPYNIPSGVTLINIFVGELMYDEEGNPTLGGFGNMNNDQISQFVEYCQSQNPPIAVKVSIGGGGGSYDDTWDLLGTTNDIAELIRSLSQSTDNTWNLLYAFAQSVINKLQKITQHLLQKFLQFLVNSTLKMHNAIKLTTDNVQAFAQGIVNFCHSLGLAGIDLDYEEFQGANQETLVGQLAKAVKLLDPTLQVSLCTNAGFGPNYPWQAVVQTILDAAVITPGVCPIDRLYIMSYYNAMSDEQGWINGWADWMLQRYNCPASVIGVGIDTFDANAYDPVAFKQWAEGMGYSTAHWAYDPAHPSLAMFGVALFLLWALARSLPAKKEEEQVQEILDIV